MTLTIGEVAERTGFPPSTLRFYERIGLVSPAGRSDANYRLYDDHVVDRLSFIERAKQLGCTLDDISDLVGIWDGEQCGPVQRRFHELVTVNIDRATRQIAELTAFSEQLHAAAHQLSRPAVDGRCSDECACAGAVLTTPAETVSEPVAFGDTPGPSVSIACTLDVQAMPERLADWRVVLDRATSRTATADGALRIEFGDGVDVTTLARLVTAEQRCCAFFAFALTLDHRGVGLEVRAPHDAGDVVTALFGSAPA